MMYDFSWLIPLIALVLAAGIVAAGYFGVLQFIAWRRANPPQYPPQTDLLPPEAYCDMGKHVVLLIVTFGIWNLIWIYRVTGYLNTVRGSEPRDPLTKLLLCIFVPFYQVYWIYRTAQCADRLSALRGFGGDMAVLYLIRAIFVPLSVPILLPDRFNDLRANQPRCG